MGVPFLAAILAVLLAHLVTASQIDPGPLQVQAVRDLLGRKGLASAAHHFHLKLFDPPDPKRGDVFRLESLPGGDVQITGNNGVSIAAGLNWFLKYNCNVSISSWNGQQTATFRLPLPVLDKPVELASPFQYRNYLNVCTFSYSAVWWNWDRWEEEIDFMALNGVNLPLAFTGQEYVWDQLFRELGLNETDIQEFFTGPAFLAWNRMGNLQKWGGGLSLHWQQRQAELQMRILERMRAFGMRPILPAFAGHVPLTLKALFPSADISTSPNWAGFNSTYSNVGLLHPQDPLFSTIAAKFLQIQGRLYGTSHYYSADTYNEMNPASNDTAFLAATSAALFQSLNQTDPEAVWVLQGWMFSFGSDFWKADQIKAYLSSVPASRMIILDMNAYSSEGSEVWAATDSYYGHNFLWGGVQNGGGRRYMAANLTRITTGPIYARKTAGSTMVGLAFVPEGIEQNPVFYELAFEMGWRSEPVDVRAWVALYATRRYGFESDLAVSAWHTLAASVYNFTGEDPSIMDFRPSPPAAAAAPLLRHARSTLQPPPSPATRLALRANMRTGAADAWRALVASSTAAAPPASALYLYDVVDLTRQALANLFADVATLAQHAYSAGWATSLHTLSATADRVMADLDSVLGTNSGFLLGVWLSDAAAWSSAIDQESLAFNARNQITLWGPNENVLNDYATKEWAGLVLDYHRPRWALYFQYMNASLSSGKPFDTDGYSAAVQEFEVQWSTGRQQYPSVPTGSTVLVAQRLVQAYAVYPPTADGGSSLYPQFNCTSADASGSSIVQASTTDPAQLRLLCAWVAECCGFTLAGWLKADCTATPGGDGTLCVKV